MGSLAQAIRLVVQPGEVFWEIKQRPKVSAGLALLLAALVVRIASIFIRGFHYADVEPEDANLIAEVTRVVGPWISWIVASYAVTAIMDGEGTFKQVTVASSFALVPYVFLTIPNALLTNVFTLGERGIIDGITSISTFWTVLLYFLSVRVIHNYTNRQALWICFLTLFTAAVFWSFIFMIWAQTDQVFTFVKEILLEIAIR